MPHRNQRAEAAGTCAAEEVKKRQELAQTNAAELAQLQQRLQAAQDDAEGKEAVVDKLASVKAWLAELRKQQRQLDADKKELDADKELLEPEDARLFIRRVLVAQGL
ncbi:MAG: hypothetical protein FRX49_05037 [Trebouxia sp. A1-2]|nr:MAG: hypothetical protein FRX49_05037 [Trebouxia sp. A1-2]